VAHQSARVNVPNHGHLITVQVKLRSFGGTPIGRNLRKLAYDERFDVRPRGLLIIEIRADIADVRIRQAHDLSGVAWVGENFLISGEAGIKNDFAAAAHNRAGRAAVKYAPVFQRENRGSVLNFRQCILPYGLRSSTAHLVLASVAESEPK